MADFSGVCELLRLAKDLLSDALSAFEFIDAPTLRAVQKTTPQLFTRYVTLDLRWTVTHTVTCRNQLG